MEGECLRGLDNMTDEHNEIIEALLEKYNDRRFERKKDINRLITDYSEGKRFLQIMLQNGRDQLLLIKSLLEQISPERWQSEVPIFSDYLNATLDLLNTVDSLQSTILLPTLSEFQSKICSGIWSSVTDLTDLIEYSVVGQRTLAADPVLFYNIFLTNFDTVQQSLKQVQRSLQTIRPERSESPTDSKFLTLKIKAPSLWFQIALLILAYFIATALLSPDIIIAAKVFARLFVLMTVLLLFPTLFLAPSTINQLTNLIIYPFLYSLVLLLWIYGFFQGVVTNGAC